MRRLTNYRISEAEADLLKRYAEATDRSRTEIVRELIRSLADKLQSDDARRHDRETTNP